MEVIGVVAEYNPFHNGHLYQLNKIKELYKDSLIVIVLNGLLTQRGIPSIETTEEKTRLALKYGADLVISLPFIFGSNSADYFADGALEILNQIGANRIIFGSECNDIKLLTRLAKNQLNNKFNEEVKVYLKEGLNYPTALSKVLGVKVNTPNDLLGISYIKSIIKNNYNIIPESIKRTNDYHDLLSNDTIISASNIRDKIKNNINIDDYIPEGNLVKVDYDKLFMLLKYKINFDPNLKQYLGVDEGIDELLLKNINSCNSLGEFIECVKTKRYTYNKISRTLIHILVSLTKEDKSKISHIEYIHILGFSLRGQKYLNSIKKEISIPTSIDKTSKTWEIEKKAILLYETITDAKTFDFENSNKPITM